MKRTDLESIYALACAAKGFQPNDAQFRIWWKTLGGLERGEVETALLSWFKNHTDFPMPAELQLAVEGIHRENAPAKEYYQQQVCPRCNGVVGMLRPIGEQFRTWCLGCQSYRQIIPEDQSLKKDEWQMLC